MNYREEYEKRLRGKSLWWWLIRVVPGDVKHYRSLLGLRIGVSRALFLWRHYRRAALQSADKKAGAP